MKTEENFGERKNGFDGAYRACGTMRRIAYRTTVRQAT
jgi:hypothetical protein